jgi:hypothetical protein
MGRCANCSKRLGFMFGKWRKLGAAKYCLPCAPGAMNRRRESTIQRIHEGSPPRTIFTVPVLSRDPDYPSNSRRFTGLLMFTDKGVIFAQYGEWKKADSGAGILFVLFGMVVAVLGVVVAGWAENKRRKAALQYVPSTSSQGGEDAVTLEDAVQVFYFPLESISKMKGRSVDCTVKADKKTSRFLWHGGKKAVRPHRHLLDAYVRAANAEQDVLWACQQVQGM